MQDLFSNIDSPYYLMGFLLIGVFVSVAMTVGFWMNRRQMPRLFFILLIGLHSILALALIVGLILVLIFGL